MEKKKKKSKNLVTFFSKKFLKIVSKTTVLRHSLNFFFPQLKLCNHEIIFSKHDFNMIIILRILAFN